jgi:class 3 adenylate cyclase
VRVCCPARICTVRWRRVMRTNFLMLQPGVTFLFTDVEGSTRWWEADADGMRVALAAHDEVLRAAIEAHGGWLFKHTGDGVCAALTASQSHTPFRVSTRRSRSRATRSSRRRGDKDRRRSAGRRTAYRLTRARRTAHACGPS